MDSALSRNCSSNSDAPCATYSQQQTYWISATVINAFGILCMIRVVYEYVTNKKMRKPVVNVFGIMMMGDIVWQAVYFPYHLSNVAKIIASDGERVVVGNTIGCQVSWYFSAFSVTLELLGLILIAYYPFQMIRLSNNFKSVKRVVSKNLIYATIALAFILSNIWFFVGFALGEIGSFRGLYCAASEWDNASGVLLFTYCGIPFVIMSYFYFYTWKTLRHQSFTSSTTGNKVQTSVDKNSISYKAAQTVFKFGCIMVVCFLATYGCFTITALMNVVGYYPPIAAEMASGLLIKCKLFLDVFVIFNMPAVKAAMGRNKKGTAPATGTDVNTFDDSASWNPQGSTNNFAQSKYMGSSSSLLENPKSSYYPNTVKKELSYYDMDRSKPVPVDQIDAVV